MTIDIKKATANVTVYVKVIDDTDGTPEAPTFESDGVDLWYMREGADHVAITEITQTAAGVHADGGFVHISDGICRLDLPDAACVAGVDHVYVGGFFTGMIVIEAGINLVDYDPFDAVRMGMTQFDGITSLKEWLGALAGKQVANATALTEIKSSGAGSGTFDEATDSTEAIREVSDDIESHVHNLSHGSAGISTAPKLSPNGFVITEGASEGNTEDTTHALDGTTHDIEDAGPNTDVYYEFLAGDTEGVPILVSWHGYVNANGATVAVFGYDFGNTAWVQIGSMEGNPGSVILTEDFTLTANLVEVGVGTVRVRFFSTDATKIATDQILLEYTAVLSSSGIVDEWESQSQADPTGFHINQLEVAGTSQTANDNGADLTTLIARITALIATKAEMDTAHGLLATPAQVAAALVTIHLDHLFAAEYDPASKPGAATALLNELIESDGGVSRYTANALEQARGTNLAALASAWTAARAVFQDNLNIGENVAGTSQVAGILNNTRASWRIPPMMERPDAGSETITLEIFLYDTDGNMEAPDSAPTIAAVDDTGASRDVNLSSTTMSLISTGRYSVTYAVADSHAIERVRFTISVIESAKTRLYGGTTQIVDTTAVDFTAADRTKLDTLHDTRITAVIATKAEIDSAHALLATEAKQNTAAGINTEARLAELAAANLPADIDTLVARITAAIATKAEMDSAHALLATVAKQNTAAGINTEARLVKLEGLPESFAKDTAAAFPIFMRLASDSKSPAPGLTVTATRSRDGAAFGGITGSIAEISGGWYYVSFSQADLNGNQIAYLFDGGVTADVLPMVIRPVS